jgi:hypothetical protein
LKIRTQRARPLFLTALVAFLIFAASEIRGSAQQTPVRLNMLPSDTIESRLRHFSRNNAEREAILKAMFAEAGCAGEELIEQPVKHEKIPNVICTLPGASSSEIIVSAHLDHVSKGDGVVDNWSGASLLPSLFQSLAGTPRKHTFVFIGFTQEEEGLIGSAFYVKSLAPGDVAKIRAAINMDSIGLGPTKVWLSHSDKKLATMIFEIANSMHLSLGFVNADRVGDDDSSSFRARKIPTLMIHSVTEDTLPILHTDRDQIKAIRLSDDYDTYRLVAVYLAYLDTNLGDGNPPPTPPPN